MKKFAKIVAIFIAVTTVIFCGSSFAQTFQGDVNGDGYVNLDDAILVLKIIAKTDTGDTKIYAKADVDGNKKIGIEDLLYILRKVLNTSTVTGKISGAGLNVGSARIKIGSDLINTTVTDSEGNFTLQADKTGESLLEITADGYATGYAKISGSESNVEIQLVPISDIIDAEDNLAEGIDLKKNGEKIGELKIPASALPDGVTQITGTVTYIDPTTRELDAFPGGDFLAVRKNGDTENPVLLETLGLMEFNLKDQDGKEITALNGDAKLCMKVPEKLSVSAGENIPLWWYNSENGLWHEDGYGIVEKRADGLWMCGSVNHFTWWNFDKPLKYHSCIKFSFVNDSDGSPINNLEWNAEGVTYSGQSPEHPCICSDNDPDPCPDENGISSFTVKKTENPAKPEQIRVFTIISGVRYYLKNDWDKTFSLVTNPETATIFNTPDVSASCIKDENTALCAFLDKEDGFLPLNIDGINFAPNIISLAADQDYQTVYPGETIKINAQVSDKEGDDLFISWSSKCGEISNTSNVENEALSLEPDVPATSSADFTSSQNKGYCSIIFKARDNKGNISESSANIKIVRNLQKEPPVVLSTKSLESGISVTFNKDIDPSTLTAETFIVNNGATGALTYKDKTAVFTPSSTFDYQTVYQATLTTGIKDAEGNALPAEYIWFFSIGNEKTDPINVDLGKIIAMTGAKKPNVVYAVDQTKQALYFIDVNAQHIFKKVDLPYPNPLAMDYSAIDNKLYIVSEGSEIITVYDIGSGVISEIRFASPSKIPFDGESKAFDIEVAPILRRIYVLCRPSYNSYLSIVNMDTGEILSDASKLENGYTLTVDEINKRIFTAQVGISRYSVQNDIPKPEITMSDAGGPGFNKVLLSSDNSLVIHSPGYALYAYNADNLNVLYESEKLDCRYARLSPDGTLLYLLAGSYLDDDYLYVMDSADFKIIRTLDFPNVHEYGLVAPNSDGSAVVGFSCGSSCKEPALYFFTNVKQ